MKGSKRYTCYLHDEPLHPAMAGEQVCPVKAAMIEWIGGFDFQGGPLRTMEGISGIQDDVDYSGDIRCILDAFCLEDR